MAHTEDLAHIAEYEDEIIRLMNQGYTAEEADELYNEEMQVIRDLHEEAWHEAISRMEEEAD